MKIYNNKTVYEAGKERIHRLYDEIDEIMVATSGGKDSTAVLYLTIEVARERGRLPLTVIYVDQEAEWREVSQSVSKLYDNPDVDFMWFQVPLTMTNNTSNTSDTVNIWGEGENWIREKHPKAIHENIYGTMKFADMFGAILKHHWPDKSCALLTGMRAQESPQRALGLLNVPTYKDITWGKKIDFRRGHYNFHPIYDWEISDVWHYIESNDLPYCAVYDKLYQLGVKMRDIRVSNLHHETAIQNLWLVQEIDGDLWSKLVERIQGVNSCDKLQKEGFGVVKELPYMFRSWVEYRDHLLENLIENDEDRVHMADRFAKQEKTLEGMKSIKTLHKYQCKEIVRNDVKGILTTQLMMTPEIRSFHKWKRDPDNFHMPEGYRNKFIGVGYDS